MIIILGRDDLRRESASKPSNKIEVWDTRLSTDQVYDADLIVFMDEEGQPHVLKATTLPVGRQLIVV